MSKTKLRKPIAPIDCTLEKLCEIRRANIKIGDYWCITDGDQVVFDRQSFGNAPEDSISIPIKVMRRFIKFLTTPQKPVTTRR